MSREILNCGLEGKLGFCQIANKTARCNQVASCVDANLQRDGDISLEEIYKIFPDITIDQAVRLRTRRQEMCPSESRPFAAFVNRVIAVASDYREQFIRRAVCEILPEGTKIELTHLPRSMDQPMFPEPQNPSKYNGTH
ncbi:MAG: hypothetical protein WD992_02820 [Candidatus Levyibacteriota bacterium]